MAMPYKWNDEPTDSLDGWKKTWRLRLIFQVDHILQLLSISFSQVFLQCLPDWGHVTTFRFGPFAFTNHDSVILESIEDHRKLRDRKKELKLAEKDEDLVSGVATAVEDNEAMCSDDLVSRGPVHRTRESRSLKVFGSRCSWCSGIRTSTNSSESAVVDPADGGFWRFRRLTRLNFS